MRVDVMQNRYASCLFFLLGALCTVCAVNAEAAKPNQAPSVSITAPVSGATFVTGVSITLTSTATDTDGTVAKVEYYRGGTTLIGVATSSPYTVQWPNAAAGSYALTAKATDNLGATKTSIVVNISVNVPANLPPSVSITSPSAGATFTAPATVNVGASATDSDGAVTKVEFYQGSALIGTATAAPYSIAWHNVAAGSYSLTAKATDNGGATKVSAAVGITVGLANRQPLVVLTAPDPCTEYAEPAAIVLAADALDLDGSIASVAFYQGATLLGSASASPYALAWTDISAGTYTLTARATDDRGVSSTSTPVTITVRRSNQLPVVTLTAPADNATFNAPTSIGFSAAATDADGTVAKVEFLVDGSVIGVATASPYAFSWINPPVGSHQVVARATDDGGGVANSAAARITVNGPPAVQITSPGSGASYVAPATIAINASATATAGPVTKLEIFDGAALLGSIATNGLSVTAAFSYTNVAAGSHMLSVKATDATGLSETSAAVPVTVNAVPVVAISLPAAGAQFGAPASVDVAANANISFGTIAKVEFFAGSTLLGTSTSVPYRIAWTGVPVGSYTLTARATSFAGVSATSSAVMVAVNAVDFNIASPLDNATLYSSDVTVSGNFTGAAPSAISANGVPARIGNSTFAVVVPLQPGINVLNVVASTSLGTVSRSVSVIRAAPTTALTNVSPGQTINDDTVTITGLASAPPNSAISVNGRLAMLAADGKFFVNNLALIEGANTIDVGVIMPGTSGQSAAGAAPTGLATGTGGRRLATKSTSVPGTSIQIFRNGIAPFSLEVDKDEGLAPFTVDVVLKNRLAYVYDRLTLDTNGDGRIDYGEDGLPIPILEREFLLTYNTPGIYPLTLTLTRGDGEIIYKATRMIHVKSPSAAAGDIRQVFYALGNRLTAGDVPGALLLVTNSIEQSLADVLNQLSPVLPFVVEEFGTVESATLYGDFAELSVVQNHDAGQYRFPVLLIRDSDGIWRIDGM